MLEFTLKFLSGESRKYEVDESTTVRQFKERLRDELNVAIERQRLIFQGKVLQDDTKLTDNNIQNKTIHFVERAEPIPPPAPNNSTGMTMNSSANGTADGGLNQALMDEVNETTSIFINAFPGAANLQPNDIQSLVQNLLNDLGDVGRQAQVNTTMASDGHGVDINIDFGNINQILEQQEINERFRSMGRMLTRVKLRLDRMEQIVESNFRLTPTPPPPPPVAAPTTSTAPERTASPARPVPTASASTTSTSSTTFLGMEDVTGTEMDAESQASIQSSETMHTPPSTTSTTPVESASTPTTSNNPVVSAPRTTRDLVELMNTVHTEEQRLQAHYQTYLRTLDQSEPFGPELAGRQRFYSLYNEVLHLISHIHHNITDLTLDLNDPLESRVLHLGELPISQAGLASVAQNASNGLVTGADGGRRVLSRPSRSIGRRPTAVATARLMGPIPFAANGNPLGGLPRMVINAQPRPQMPFRPPAPSTANNSGMQQSMRFNLGTLPYTFMQMGPDGITLNQVSASVVADVQTANSTSQEQQTPTNNPNNRPTPGHGGSSATHVISSGPIQLNAGHLDANIAAEIAQRVTNSVQQHIAQMVNQQMHPGGANNSQPANNQNADGSTQILRSTFVVQPDSTPTSVRANEALRSRSADSRPVNSHTSTSTGASGIDDDDSEWIDLPMDGPISPPTAPNPSVVPMPRFRVPAIIQSIDRSLPCTSPYFTQTLRPPFDNPNNATNITPNEAAALNNASGRAVFMTSAPQRPRGRHRHPAGPWAQQTPQMTMPNFVFGPPGGHPGATILAAGQPYNVTAHSFEIPMRISPSTTTEIPNQPTAHDNAQATANNDGQQAQMNAVISQVLSQILPGVLRSGNGRVRLNIGQNNPTQNPANAQPSSSQTPDANPASPPMAPPNTANIPGVMAGGLDFSNIARTFGTMIQGMTGRLIPGATLMTPPSAPATAATHTSTGTSPSARSSNTPSSQTSNNPPTSSNTSNANEVDTMTGPMLNELLRLLGGGLDSPELDNLTIGGFMQRFGEDVDARSNDGTNLISELFSTMTARMRFTDVWNLVLGNTVGPRINEARESAMEYLRTTVLHGRPLTPETVDEVADRLYESLLQEASIDFNELRVKPNINIKNVMKRFFHHHARKLLLILFENPDNVWFANFRQQLLTMRNEYLALSSHCLEGGEAAAVDFILHRHRIIFRSTNPMIVTWSETYLRTSLTTAFHAIRATPPDISSYLIEPPVRVAPPPPPPPAPVATPTKPPTQLSSIVNKTDHEREEAAAAAASSSTAPSPASLQGNIPDEWIPIVIRDINAQRDARAQPPFSDAYRDGMPAKRRRVHLREDLTSNNLLQTLVLRSTATNSTADTAERVLSGEAVSSTLINTFEQELKRLLEQRIRQDQDYPEVKHRMPNTKRYLDGDK